MCISQPHIPVLSDAPWLRPWGVHSASMGLQSMGARKKQAEMLQPGPETGSQVPGMCGLEGGA